MIKSILILSFLGTSLLSYSQQIRHVELTLEDYNYLKEDIRVMGEPTDDEIHVATSQNLINYDFEMIYNQKVIYRGTINKPFVSKDFSAGLYRTEVGFTIPYEVLDTDTILELIENKNAEIIESKSGKKYVANGHFRLFDLQTGTVNKQLSSKITLKYYKLIYK